MRAGIVLVVPDERKADGAAAGRARLRYIVLGVGVALPMAIFTFLAAVVAPREPGSWDRTVFAQLYSGESDWPLGPTPGRDNPLLQVIMPQLERLNDDREIFVLVALVIVAALIRGRARVAGFFAAAIAIGACSPLFKEAFERDSPFPLPGQSSFPSGHGLASMAIAAAAVVLATGTRWLVPVAAAAGVLVLALSSSVIADGGHWLSDVVAGWCLAVAWVAGLWLAVSLRAGDEPVGAYLRARTFPRKRRSAVE